MSKIEYFLSAMRSPFTATIMSDGSPIRGYRVIIDNTSTLSHVCGHGVSLEDAVSQAAGLAVEKLGLVLPPHQVSGFPTEPAQLAPHVPSVPYWPISAPLADS